MARAWFFLVLLNSSSFSAILRSISCLVWPSSRAALSTLFSSASRAPSASSRADWSSSFSVSSLLLCLSSSWIDLPPSPSWSRRSLISSARFLFSRRTMSSCSLVSSREAFKRKVSAEKLRHSEWQASSSACRSSAFAFHSPTTLSKFLPLFSVMIAAAWVRSYSMAMSSSSASIRIFDFSADPILALSASMCSSASETLELSLGLGEGLQHVVLLLSLLVDLHSQVLGLGHQVLVLGEEGRTVARLSIGEPLGVLQLGLQGDFVLVQVGDGVLGLLDLPAQVLRLNLQLLLGRIGLVQSTGQLVQLLVGLHDQSLAHLAVLLHVGAVPHGFLKPGPGLLEIPFHASLVLLRLGLVLVDCVNLLSKAGHAVVVFLAERSQGALVGNVGLIQIHLQLGKLGLSLLVELDLGAGVGSSLLQPSAQVLEVPGQQGAVLLSLGSHLPLDGELLVKLVNT